MSEEEGCIFGENLCECVIIFLLHRRNRIQECATIGKCVLHKTATLDTGVVHHSSSQGDT